jgi:hypothetical protein
MSVTQFRLGEETETEMRRTRREEDSQTQTLILLADSSRLVKLITVFSCEEFLLNAYRLSKQGVGIHFLVDGTYRLTTERNLGYLICHLSPVHYSYGKKLLHLQLSCGIGNGVSFHLRGNQERNRRCCEPASQRR